MNDVSETGSTKTDEDCFICLFGLHAMGVDWMREKSKESIAILQENVSNRKDVSKRMATVLY